MGIKGDTEMRTAIGYALGEARTHPHYLPASPYPLEEVGLTWI